MVKNLASANQLQESICFANSRAPAIHPGRPSYGAPRAASCSWYAGASAILKVKPAAGPDECRPGCAGRRR